MILLFIALSEIVDRVFYFAKQKDENFYYDTEHMYSIFLKHINSKNKKMQYYIAKGITILKEFQAYENLWEYVYTIPKILPKHDSFTIFRMFITVNFESIPANYKVKFKEKVEEYIQKNPQAYELDSFIYDETLSKLG